MLPSLFSPGGGREGRKKDLVEAAAVLQHWRTASPASLSPSLLHSPGVIVCSPSLVSPTPCSRINQVPILTTGICRVVTPDRDTGGLTELELNLLEEVDQPPSMPTAWATPSWFFFSVA